MCVQRLHAGDGLERARRPEPVAGERLDRAHGWAALPEDGSGGGDLCAVVRGRAGAVRREVADLAAVDARVLERRLHRTGRAAPLRVRADDVERVAGEADPRKLGERHGSPRGGGCRRLDDEHRSSLTENESVAVGAERPARLGGEGSEPRETREGDARERVGAAGENRVGPSEPDQVERVAERVVARRARSRKHGHAPAQAELGRDVTADLVGAGADELLGGDSSRPHVRRLQDSSQQLSPIVVPSESDVLAGQAGLSERLPPGRRREQSRASRPRRARALERETANLAADPGRKPGVSNDSTWAAPVVPSSAAQKVSTSAPTGETTPRPVTTARSTRPPARPAASGSGRRGCRRW